jgi:hypothetical protein
MAHVGFGFGRWDAGWRTGSINTSPLPLGLWLGKILPSCSSLNVEFKPRFKRVELILVHFSCKAKAIIVHTHHWQLRGKFHSTPSGKIRPQKPLQKMAQAQARYYRWLYNLWSLDSGQNPRLAENIQMAPPSTKARYIRTVAICTVSPLFTTCSRASTRSNLAEIYSRPCSGRRLQQPSPVPVPDPRLLTRALTHSLLSAAIPRRTDVPPSPTPHCPLGVGGSSCLLGPLSQK